MLPKGKGEAILATEATSQANNRHAGSAAEATVDWCHKYIGDVMLLS